MVGWPGGRKWLRGDLDRWLAILTPLLLATALAAWGMVLVTLLDMPESRGAPWPHSARLVAAALAGAAIAGWWLQRLVLDHELIVRLIYAFAALFLVFIIWGGVCILLTNLVFIDDSYVERRLLVGLRFEPLWSAYDGAFSYRLFVLNALELHILLLLAGGALFIACFRR